METNFKYKNVMVLQNENIGNVFKELFIKTQPKRILEIGTAYGGLTYLLRDLLTELNMTETDIRSYDIINYHGDFENIDFRIENIFNAQYNGLISDDVISFVKQSGVTIVLCDGQYKKQEFNILSEFIKDDDVIMAHDYSPTLEYFEETVKGKIWDWCEIVDSDIQNSNLKPFMSEEFKDVVWCCKMK